MGAGLDTRPYRFKPFQINQHIVFEIDFPNVIDYKEKVMHEKKPLCKVIRLSADLMDLDWSSHLLKKGFSKNMPTFWIMEGLVYYLKQDTFSTLITKMTELSKGGSQIFIDVIYASTAMPFSYSQNIDSTKTFSNNHIRGINIKEISGYFASTGWEVSSSYVNKYDQSRNIGQKGMVFVQGKKI
jgi:methyltransferase (TIGR00027 family)